MDREALLHMEGKEVSLLTTASIVFHGRLLKVTEKGVIIQTAKSSSVPSPILFANIKSCIEMGPAR